MKLNFSDNRILVIGDVMLDRYVYCEQNRMSPESDAPLLDKLSTNDYLGGAANVAVNLINLGAKTWLLGEVGVDEVGARILDLLEQSDINHLLIKTDKKSCLKTRYMLEDKQVLRVDDEDRTELADPYKQKFLQNLNDLVSNVILDMIIIQDYNKGLLSKDIIESIIKIGKDSNIKIAVDPKEKNFFSYENVDLFKPNLRELSMAISEDIPLDQVEIQAEKIRQRLNSKMMLVTLSSNGLLLLSNEGTVKLDAEKIEDPDVSGAGDAVISLASLALCNNYKLEDIALLSNLAGAQICRQKGVGRLDLEKTHADLEKVLKQD